MKLNDKKQYDVYGLGNALVDLLAEVPDNFLKSHDIQKGIMTLTEEEAQKRYLAEIKQGDHPVVLASGGSVCNTMVTLARLGSRGYYSGKIGHDEYGHFFKKDLLETGLGFHVHPGVEQHTGTVLVLMTPDADRTMLTNLGIARSLTPDDLEEEHIRQCKIVYIEGYLWDAPGPKDACLRAMELARKHEVKIALSYSDPFVIERSRSDFHELTRDFADIVFCNNEEACHYAQTEDPEEALEVIGRDCPLVFMTRGKQGAYFNHEGQVTRAPVEKIKAEDTTGAGDNFAAGAFYGLLQSYPLNTVLEMGNHLAGQVIQKTGPRLEGNLRRFVEPFE